MAVVPGADPIEPRVCADAPDGGSKRCRGGLSLWNSRGRATAAGAVTSATRPSPTGTRGLASNQAYPLERGSLLRRDRATRSRVCLRLRSHSIQQGLCNATGAGCSATVGATCQTLHLIPERDHFRKARSATNSGR